MPRARKRWNFTEQIAANLPTVRLSFVADNLDLSAASIPNRPIDVKLIQMIVGNDSPIGDGELVKFANLEDLVEIQITNQSPIDGNGLVYFTNCRNLKWLVLDGTGADATNLAIANPADIFPNLKTLTLRRCRDLKDAGDDWAKILPSGLSCIDVGQTDVGMPDLIRICTHCTTLTRLYIDSLVSPITDDAVAAIAALTELRILDCTGGTMNATQEKQFLGSTKSESCKLRADHH